MVYWICILILMHGRNVLSTHSILIGRLRRNLDDGNHVVLRLLLDQKRALVNLNINKFNSKHFKIN